MVASPEYVDNIVATFDRAADANRQTPGRRGSVVALTPKLPTRSMITGDIHGHRRNFNLIRRLAALDRHGRHLVLQEVCHGGPSYRQNGGCMSHTILEDVAALKVQYPERVHFILGNHELAEMTDYPIQKNRLLLNCSFGWGCSRCTGRPRRRSARRFAILVDLPVGGPTAAGNVRLSQPARGRRRRGFDPVGPRRTSPPADCWNKRTFFGCSGAATTAAERPGVCGAGGGQIPITGHEPCQEGFVAPNDLQIILDCCGDKAAYALLPVGPDSATPRLWST